MADDRSDRPEAPSTFPSSDAAAWPKFGGAGDAVGATPTAAPTAPTGPKRVVGDYEYYLSERLGGAGSGGRIASFKGKALRGEARTAPASESYCLHCSVQYAMRDLPKRQKAPC